MFFTYINLVVCLMLLFCTRQQKQKKEKKTQSRYLKKSCIYCVSNILPLTQWIFCIFFLKKKDGSEYSPEYFLSSVQLFQVKSQQAQQISHSILQIPNFCFQVSSQAFLS